METSYITNKIFALKFFIYNNLINIVGINTQNMKRRQEILTYPLSIYFLVAENMKGEMCNILHNLYDPFLDSIIDTNILLETNSNSLLEILTQSAASTLYGSYHLIKLEFLTMNNLTTVYKFLLNNNVGKKYYFTIESTDVHFMLQMELYINAVSLEGVLQNSLSKLNQIPKLKFRKLKRNVGNLAVENIFRANGVYTITDSKRLILDAFYDYTHLYKYIPVVSFDIETGTDNLEDLPLGGFASEKLLMFVLYCEYLEVEISIISYLKCRGTPNDFDAEMRKKYEKPPTKYIWVEGFVCEEDLIANFLYWYSQGYLLKMLTGYQNYPHYFVGHNIIEYDLKFLLTRLRVLNMQSEINAFVTLGKLATVPLIRFHRDSIILDTLMVLKKNALTCGNLSLANLSKNYLSQKFKKIDLNSVLMRIYYILDDVISDDGFRGECMKNIFKIEPYRRETFDSTTAEYTNMQLYRTDYITRSVWRKLTNETNAESVIFYRMEQALIYNERDCVAVIGLYNKFNLAIFTNQLANLFNCNLEDGSMNAISHRIATAFLYHAVSFGMLPGCQNNDSVLLTVSNMKCLALTERTSAMGLPPIYTKPKFIHTKKEYPGAAVFANQGIFWNVVQYDVNSFYPNIIINKRLSRSTVGCCCSKALTLVFEKSPMTRDSFDLMIKNDMIGIYITEDQNQDYSKYVDLEYFGEPIGKMITSVAELDALAGDTPVLIRLLLDSKTPFTINFIESLLGRRKTVKDEMKSLKKELKNPKHSKEDIQNMNLEYSVLDCKQLSLKIMVNSTYGLFGTPSFKFASIPVAIGTTLFARKLLIHLCRVTPVLYLLHAIRDYKQNINNLTEKELMQLIYCIRQDAYDTYSGLEANKQLITYDEKKIASVMRKIPREYRRMVFDADTDGYQFANFLNLNSNQFLQLINEEMNLINGPGIILEGSEIEASISLVKKKYLHLTKLIDYSIFYKNPNQDALKHCSIVHKGYERNASRFVKRIFNFVAGLAFFYAKITKTNQYNHLEKFLNFENVLLAIYNYLFLVEQAELYENVKLVRLKNASARQKYIDSLNSSYVGRKKTVLLYHPEDCQADVYLTLERYSKLPPRVKINGIPRPGSYQIHYGKYMRNYVKAIYAILKSVVNQTPTKNYTRITNECFKQWFENYQYYLTSHDPQLDIAGGKFPKEFIVRECS